jgi:Fe-S cluster biogenesis protein NfuA
MKWNVVIEKSPNPETLIFKLNSSFCDQIYTYNHVSDCDNSPLAQKLFGFPWAESVVIGFDRISLSKQDWVDWDVVAEPLREIILEHFENEEPLFIETQEFNDPNMILPSDSAVVQQIKSILKKEIRPSVALDGGDIAFVSYENFNLKVHMKGACSSCPSKSITLKNGIESRIKQSIPEVQSVQAL